MVEYPPLGVDSHPTRHIFFNTAFPAGWRFGRLSTNSGTRRLCSGLGARSARDLVRPRFGSRSSEFRSALFVLGSARLGDGSRLIQLGTRLGTRLGLAPGLAQADCSRPGLARNAARGAGTTLKLGGGGDVSRGPRYPYLKLKTPRIWPTVLW